MSVTVCVCVCSCRDPRACVCERRLSPRFCAWHYLSWPCHRLGLVRTTTQQRNTTKPERLLLTTPVSIAAVVLIVLRYVCVMFGACVWCGVPYTIQSIDLILYCVGMARSVSWLASTPPTGEQPHRSYLLSTHTLWYPSSSAPTPMPLPLPLTMAAVAVAVAAVVVIAACWDVRRGRKYQSARTSTCCQCALSIQFDTDILTCTTPSEDAR